MTGTPDAPARPEPAADVSPAERIVAAAESCFDRYGVEKTTVEDIARAAALSRATVYRYFVGGRDDVILAVLFRDFQKLLPRLSAHLAGAATISDGLVEAFVEALTFVREESRPEAMLMVQRMMKPTPTAAGGPGGTQGQVFKILVESFRPSFEQAQADGLVRDGVTLRDAVDFVTRMLFSMLATPDYVTRTEAQLRDYLRVFVAGGVFRTPERPSA